MFLHIMRISRLRPHGSSATSGNSRPSYSVSAHSDSIGKDTRDSRMAIRSKRGQTVVAGAIVWRAAPYTPATRSVY
jgi:hypothetical protein